MKLTNRQKIVNGLPDRSLIFFIESTELDEACNITEIAYTHIEGADPTNSNKEDLNRARNKGLPLFLLAALEMREIMDESSFGERGRIILLKGQAAKSFGPNLRKMLERKSGGGKWLKLAYYTKDQMSKRQSELDELPKHTPQGSRNKAWHKIAWLQYQGNQDDPHVYIEPAGHLYNYQNEDGEGPRGIYFYTKTNKVWEPIDDASVLTSLKEKLEKLLRNNGVSTDQRASATHQKQSHKPNLSAARANKRAGVRDATKYASGILGTQLIKNHPCCFYATDHSDPEVWEYPETHVYFDYQAKEYTKRSWGIKDGKFHLSIQPSKLLARALTQAASNLKKNDLANAVMAFEDWDFETTPNSRKTKQLSSPSLEIIRLLLWPVSRLCTEESEMIINRHKAFNIPCFYLNPDKLRAEGILREEYMLVCKPNQVGITNSADKLIMWEPNGFPRSDLHDLKWDPLEHFRTLLFREDLIFAAHARELAITAKL